MRTFTLEIQMENAAFDDAPEIELATILRDIAIRIEDQGVDFFTVRRRRSQSWAAVDTNGNTVGDFRVLK